MGIELSGVQFALKSYMYACFQNRMSAQREFDLKSQLWFQTKIARPEVRFAILKSYNLIAKFAIANNVFFCLSFSFNEIG